MLPSKKCTVKVGEKEIIVETGHLARNASAAVTISCEDTVILVTVGVGKEPREGIDFFPLLVDFDEKLFCVGRVPGSFLRREGRPTDKAILSARLIDRPIRPLFPDGYHNDVQVTTSILSSDSVNPPDVLALLGSSFALIMSEAPFLGPIGAVRVGRVDGEFVVNPTFENIEKGDLDIVVAGTADSIMMVEAGAKFVSEEDIVAALKYAQEYISIQIEAQHKFVKELEINKEEFVFDTDLDPLIKFIDKNYEKPVIKAYKIADRLEREKAVKVIKDKMEDDMAELADDHPIAVLLDESGVKYHHAVFKALEKRIMRSMIINDDIRVDGRALDEIRPIDCSVGILPRTHGTGLFTRGNTQVLSITTLGGPGEAQELDGVDPQKKREYIHHYTFPAFSVGEVKPNRGPGRREVGHGYLAEKALTPSLPPKDQFPYTIRVNSEVLESNGSTSMASTCGSTLALMDAGVPISQPIAGVAMGLIKENETVKILTDIQGIEDFLGDMDFKVAGSDKGITALQMDIKILGISIDIIEKALTAAKSGRLHILGKMLEAIPEPRKALSKWAPRIVTLKIDPDTIGTVIGPGGKTIRGIIEETGATIDIENDGTVNITCVDAEGSNKAIAIIKKLTRKLEKGLVLQGKVVRIISKLGAFVEVAPGVEGMVHISQLVPYRVHSVNDVVSIGEEVIVKVDEIDEKGRVNLTIKGLTPEEKDKFLEEEYC
ncbi:MAG: polyribonucleotide nucleotidyltransferase [Cyanobacteriota bacterium]